MKNDYQLTETIERYLAGRMSPGELAEFEQLRKEHTEIEGAIAEHRQFIGMIKHYGERTELERRLNAIHQEIDVHALVEQVTVHPPWIVSLWRNHHSKISVAASVAIFAILSTMFFTGYFNNNDTNRITQLSSRVDYIAKQTIAIKQQVQSSHNGLRILPKVGPTNQGSGFALTSSGYIVTNYHVIKDADSVYVENANGDSYHAKVIYVETQYDIAILKIDDKSFEGLGALPYTFKKGKSDLGEEVWNYGYPDNEPNYGSGSISSAFGINGDSTSYRVSVPVNPGASGSPLIDAKGNIIGIVNLKQIQVEGAHFAVKSSYLLKAIDDIPVDSLKGKLILNSKNTLAGLSRPQQIKKLGNYVFKVNRF